MIKFFILGFRQIPTELNLFVAHLYPQRGVATSVLLQCENGQIVIPGRLSQNIKISYQCDEVENCVVN